MRNFDEKRVEYLKKRAEVDILSKRQEDIDEQQKAINEWLQACDLYDKELTKRIEDVGERKEKSIKTFEKKIENTEGLIEFVLIDMKRADYQKEIPENLEELWELGQSENPEEKVRYEDAINKMGIMLAATKYALADLNDYSKPLRDYIDTLNLYRQQKAEYDDMVENQYISEDMDTLYMIFNEDNEQSLKLRDRVNKLVGGDNVLKGMLDAYASYQDALKAQDECKKDKEIIEEVKKSIKEEWSSVKNGGAIKRKALRDNPVVKSYRKDAKEITNLKKKLDEKRVADVFEVPDTFTKLRSLPEDDRKKAEGIINQKIAEYHPEDGNIMVLSVNEYYTAVENAETAKNQLQAFKKKKLQTFSTDCTEMLKVKTMSDVTSKFKDLTRALDEYEKNLRISEENFIKVKEEEIKINPIPKSFTELSKLKPKDPDTEKKLL